MSAGLHLLERVERFASHIRERFHDHHERDFIMQFLDDLIAKAKSLAEPDAALTARAEKAEGDLTALQQQVAADEQKAKDALDALNAADPTQQPAQPGSGASTVTTSVGTTSTTATDPTTGNTTTVDHATGQVNTVDSTGAAVATDTAAAQAATSAAQAAGVTVPSA